MHIHTCMYIEQEDVIFINFDIDSMLILTF